MVFRRALIPICPEPRPGPSYRSVLDASTSIAALCSPERRPPSGGNRCDVLGLEPVVEDLPLSPSEPSDEGSKQIENLPGDSDYCGPSVASEQLVSTGSGALSSTGPSPGTDPQPDSTAAACLRFLLADPKASFAGFFSSSP